MTPYQKRRSPITQPLAEDMKIRNMAQATIDAYTYHIGRFADFIKKPLARATPKDVRTFQLHLIEERKVGFSSFNQAVCAMRFLYSVTLPRKWPVKMIPFGKRPKKLPTVLANQQVEALLRCTPNLKHRTLLMTLYAAGLRLAEATHLKIPDIDSQRMQINVAHGKGAKGRLVPLSPRLLEALRHYWRAYRPPLYLFPGKTPERPYAASSIQKAIKVAARKAGIRKNVHPHVLRHSFATSLLEAGVDLLTISRLLGHSSFMTTMVYLHCRREHLNSAPSPLDWLPVRQLPGWHQQQTPGLQDGPNSTTGPSETQTPNDRPPR